jgi:hypothetical protein
MSEPLNGTVTLVKALAQHEIWLAEPFNRAQAWVDLLLLANDQPRSFRARGKLVNVERGQLGRSVVTLAERWKWGRNKVIGFLDYLEHLGMVKVESDNITTIITVINYDCYNRRAKTAAGTAGGTPDGTPDETAGGTQKVEVGSRKEEEEPEHTHRAGAQGFAEAPSLTEVIAWGREWPGEFASGTPGFDLDWLRDWFDKVDNFLPPIWPRLRDWRTDCITQWRKFCRASAKKGGGAFPGAKPTAQTTLPAWQRKAELEARIAQHPANPDSGFDGVVTPELEAGLQRLEDELAALEAKKPAA